MRELLLFFVMIIGIGVSCVESTELLTVSDDSSNGFVLTISGQIPKPNRPAKEQRALRNTADEQGPPRQSRTLRHLDNEFTPAGRALLSLCSVQRT